MRGFIKDMLMVKTIEREIGRSLSPDELDMADAGEPLDLKKPNGDWLTVQIKLYRMPYGLMTEEPEMAKRLMKVAG